MRVVTRTMKLTVIHSNPTVIYSDPTVIYLDPTNVSDTAASECAGPSALKWTRPHVDYRVYNVNMGSNCGRQKTPSSNSLFGAGCRPQPGWRL